jgi:DNA polymerase-1
MTAPLDASSRLFLIDGSGYIFRAYHALPPLTRASDGLPVGAVSGFCNMVWKFLEDMKAGERPTHLAVIFDKSEKSFRKDIYPAYKANRPPPPEDLVPQFGLIREATKAFGLPCIEMEGFEADDLIATYARQAAAKGARVDIVSSDKDLMQLIDGDRIFLFDPMKSKPLGLDAVMEKFGVAPDKVIDVQALMGDSVDNVPGARGIGPKTAAELITSFGSLEAVLARTAEITQPKRREALEQCADLIRISKQLVTLRDDVPVEEPAEAFGVRDFDHNALLAFLEMMEFRTLTRRVREDMVKEGKPIVASLEASPAAETAPIDRSAYKTLTSVQDLDAFVRLAAAEGVVAFDTETSSLDVTRAKLVGVSLGLSGGRAVYAPLGHVHPDSADDLFAADKPAPNQIPLGDALTLLKPLLEDQAVLKVAQNAKFDLSILARHGINVSPIDDTMLISYALAAGLHGHGMDELSERRLGHTPISFESVCGKGKGQISFDRAPIDKAAIYAAEDADITFRLWAALKPRLAQEGCLTAYETLERPMPSVLAAMERAGIKVDREELSRMSGEFAQRMAAMEEEARALAGRDFNIGSPKQLGDILFDEMGLPGGVKTKTGAWGTDASVLEGLASQGHALPKTILDWRQLQKLRSTYTEALKEAINPETGRVHTSFSLASTTTGRLSSSDPNLQNIPIRTEEGRRIREAFVAEPGHLLISADYSQIELRLLAHVGDVPQLKKAFIDGLDIHAMTASEMFGVPVKGMDPAIRRQAKAINFGIIYGISAFGLAANLGIDQKEAGAYIKQYFERFPGIRDYMENTKAFARAHGYVRTIFGRRCWIAGIKSKTPNERAFAERQAINAPLQGAAADIIRRAMARVPQALAAAGLKTRMLLQVHDELVFEAPEAEAGAACALVKQVMEGAAAPAAALSIPLIVAAKAARTWGQAH